PQRIHYAADQSFADRHAHDASCTLDLFAFLDFGVVAEEHDADLVFFKVHGDAGHVMRKGKKFSGHHLVEAANAGDTVAQADDCANFIDGNLRFVVLD